MTDETFGTLLGKVKAWCRDHGAEYVSIGRGRIDIDSEPPVPSAWKVDVCLGSGRRVHVVGLTHAEVMSELDRQRNKRGSIWAG